MTIRKEKAVQDLNFEGEQTTFDLNSADEKIIFDPTSPRDRAVIDSIGLALSVTESDRSKGRSATAQSLSKVVRMGMKEQANLEPGEQFEVGETEVVVARNLEDRVQIAINQNTSLVVFTGEAEDVAEAAELAGSIVDAKSSETERYLSIPEGAFRPALEALRVDFEEFSEGVVINLEEYRESAATQVNTPQVQPDEVAA